MKLLLAIAIIAAIAIIGSRITFFNRRLPLGIRNILFTGTEYIFIGLILGPFVLGILDEKTLLQLESFLWFGMAWIGFLFGLQFEIRLLKKLPRYYFSITAIQSTVTFLIVAFALYLLLSALSIFSDEITLYSAMVLGAAASCTAQSAIAIVNLNYRIENKGLLELLRYISSVDGIFALVYFVLALSLVTMINATEGTANSILVPLKWIAISVGVGAIPSFILIILSQNRFNNNEFTLFVIGILLFCGGLAQQLSYSPLISGMICGVFTANFCKQRLRAIQLVVHAEKSIYILLLLFIGAYWKLQFNVTVLIGIAYFLFRITGKVVGVFLSTRLFKPQYRVPLGAGLGLISEGGLVVAIILNFHVLYPTVAESLITVVVFSILLSEFISPKLILKQLESEKVVLKNS